MSTHIDALYEEWSADERDAELEDLHHERERLDRLSEFGSSAWFISPGVASGAGPGSTARAASSSHDHAVSHAVARAGSPPPPTPGGSSRTSHVARPGAEDSDESEAA